MEVFMEEKYLQWIKVLILLINLLVMLYEIIYS